MAVGENKSIKPTKKTERVRLEGTSSPQEKRLRIKLAKSLIGSSRYQREVVKGLGLRKVNSEVVRKDSPEIWGMIKKVPHLLEVEAVEEK